MKSSKRLLIASVYAALLAVTSGSSLAGGTPPDTAAATVSAMRAGGLTLVFRHTATEPGHEQELSEQGEKQARGVGMFLRDLHVPLGAAYSGQAKRAIDMARLAGFPSVTRLDALTDSDPSSPTAQTKIKTRADEFRRLLRQRTRRGENLVVIADHDAILSALGDETADVQEGELIVVRSDANSPNGFRIVGRLTLRNLRDHWRQRSGKAR